MFQSNKLVLWTKLKERVRKREKKIPYSIHGLIECCRQRFSSHITVTFSFIPLVTNLLSAWLFRILCLSGIRAFGYMHIVHCTIINGQMNDDVCAMNSEWHLSTYVTHIYTIYLHAIDGFLFLFLFHILTYWLVNNSKIDNL